MLRRGGILSFARKASLNRRLSKQANRRLRVQVEFNARRRDCTIGVVPTSVFGSPMVEMFAALFRRQLLAIAAAIAAIVYSPLPVAAEISAQEAVDHVQQETGGKVLSVQTLRLGTRKIFRIKVLTPGGQVRVVEVQADQ